MRGLLRGYDALIAGSAKLGNLLVAGIFVAILYDVAQRSFGLRPPSWTSALSEYAMLYMTMLAAPALVRQRGHVAVDSLITRLAPAAQAWVGRLIYFFCVVICVLLACYGAAMAWDAASRGEMDVRSIEIPRWMLLGVLPIGFGLCAIEFARLLRAGAIGVPAVAGEGSDAAGTRDGRAD